MTVTLLVLAGIALMAVAIFAPRRLIQTPVSVAAAPERKPYDEPLRVPHWPQLVEPTARAVDAAARIDLVDALAALDSAWSEGVLRQALVEETDPAVRDAVVKALSSSTQSLVT
jgi:hypothetical protein